MAPIMKTVSALLCGTALCAFVADGQRPIGGIRESFKERLQQLLSNDNSEATEQDSDDHSGFLRSSNIIKDFKNSNIAEALDSPQLREEIYRVGKDLGIDADDINEEFIKELITDIGADELAEKFADAITGEHVSAIEKVADQLTGGDIEGVKDAAENIYNNLSEVELENIKAALREIVAKVDDADISAIAEAIKLADSGDIKAMGDYLSSLDFSNISDFFGNIDEAQLNSLEKFVNGILDSSGSKMTLDFGAAKSEDVAGSAIKALSHSEGITFDGGLIDDGLRDVGLIESLANAASNLGEGAFMSGHEKFVEGFPDFSADLAEDDLMDDTVVDSANNIVTNLRGKLENVRDSLNEDLVDDLSISDGLIEANMGSNDLEGLRENLDEVRDSLENGLIEVTDAANAIQEGIRETIDKDFVDEVAGSGSVLKGRLRVRNAAKTIAEKISDSIASGFIDEVSA